MSYEILIIGAGTAGMACAITAAENGSKVLVIEKADSIGGTLHITGGHLSAGGTNRQKSRGIQDSPSKHFREVMNLSRNTADAKLVKLAVEEAPNTLNWLEKNGFEFAEESPRIIYGHVPYQKPRTHYGKENGLSILKVLQRLWSQQVSAGKLTILLNHKLEKLIIKNNKVIGVIANGQKFFAENTVLATGGYAGNPKLFAKLHPQNPRLITAASTNSTGEGIEIAVQAGGKIWNTEKHLSSLGGVEIEPNSHRADFWTHWAMVYTSVYRPPREIYVNSEGNRFMDENEPNADLRERFLEKQNGEKFWAIFDENSLNGEMQILPKFTPDQIRDEAKKGKFLWQAETIEKLANLIGINAENLRRTVSEFNEFVANGKDEKFGRTYLKNQIIKPPFYALLSYAASLISFGGLAVNDDLQVVNDHNEAIPNLYAIGEIIGAGATTGNAFCSGMLVTPALSFGRILGRKLSRK
jgi:flavocytochrome c